MPFILRGVKLLGVDSVMCPFEQRMQAWNRLAELLPESFYTRGATEIGLQAVPEMAESDYPRSSDRTDIDQSLMPLEGLPRRLTPAHQLTDQGWHNLCLSTWSFNFYTFR